jgi:hypothetical protein
MCPWYDTYNQKCKLHGGYMGGSSTQKEKCENSNWRNCGDAQAKAEGRNYQTWVFT